MRFVATRTFPNRSFRVCVCVCERESESDCLASLIIVAAVGSLNVIKLLTICIMKCRSARTFPHADKLIFCCRQDNEIFIWMPMPMQGRNLTSAFFPALGQLVLTLLLELAKPVQSLPNNLRGLAPAGQILSLIQFIQTSLLRGHPQGIY